MTDMMQLALDSLREYERRLFTTNDNLDNVARLAEMRIAFAQALELRRTAVALEHIAAVLVAVTAAVGEADLTPHDLGE